uniref:Uncharacterized protein n=1 Tax=Lepeophtheirus salmonis TaxID=72036 RepID=A0A0K2TC20_LEPSM
MIGCVIRLTVPTKTTKENVYSGN